MSTPTYPENESQSMELPIDAFNSNPKSIIPRNKSESSLSKGTTLPIKRSELHQSTIILPKKEFKSALPIMKERSSFYHKSESISLISRMNDRGHSLIPPIETVNTTTELESLSTEVEKRIYSSEILIMNNNLSSPEKHKRSLSNNGLNVKVDFTSNVRSTSSQSYSPKTSSKRKVSEYKDHILGKLTVDKERKSRHETNDSSIFIPYESRDKNWSIYSSQIQFFDKISS